MANLKVTKQQLLKVAQDVLGPDAKLEVKSTPDGVTVSACRRRPSRMTISRVGYDRNDAYFELRNALLGYEAHIEDLLSDRSHHIEALEGLADPELLGVDIVLEAVDALREMLMAQVELDQEAGH